MRMRVSTEVSIPTRDANRTPHPRFVPEHDSAVRLDPFCLRVPPVFGYISLAIIRVGIGSARRVSVKTSQNARCGLASAVEDKVYV